MEPLVTIYLLDMETMGNDDSILPVIAPFYIRKTERAKSPLVKQQELGAGLLLARYLGVTRDAQLSFGEHGKPYLSDGSKAFSLSHSGHYVALAAAEDPVGIDIERMSRITLPVLKRVLPPARYEVLLQTAPEGALDAKIEWAKEWTSVEAVLKAAGCGFHFDRETLAKLLSTWYVESLPADREFMISVAYGRALTEGSVVCCRVPMKRDGAGA